MNIEHLIVMANQIGAFFSTEAPLDEAAANVAQHLKRFWDPRMRSALIAHAQQHGTGLNPEVLKAVRRLAEETGPASHALQPDGKR